MMVFDRKTLLRAAMKAREFSYSPYSKFKVGAALLCADGKIFTGCNIENSAYSPSLCAERCAVAKAVSEGARDFIAIAVVGPEDSETTPCGVCRQVLQEFAPDLEVILVNCKGETTELTLRELLPYGFDSGNLK